MHECRIYTNYPEQGGKLKRVINPDECRKLFHENMAAYTDLSRRVKTFICEEKDCEVTFKSTADNAKYCAEHRAGPVEEHKYL